MKAALNHLRPLRDDSIRNRRGSQALQAVIDARFLVLDVTVPVCISEPFREPSVPGCIGSHWLKHFVVRLDRADAALQIFKGRNRRSLPIRGYLGADVVLVPATAVADTYGLVRRYPLGSAIVTFSAPAYLDGTAILAYHVYSATGGFVHLDRRGGDWKVFEQTAWME